jgi:hypothetical protein
LLLPSYDATYNKPIKNDFNLKVRYKQLWKEHKYQFMRILNYDYKYGNSMISREYGIQNIHLLEYKKI